MINGLRDALMINGLRDGLMINGLRDALMITRWFWPILADYGKFLDGLRDAFDDGCFDGLRDASGLFWRITGSFDGLRDALPTDVSMDYEML